MCTARVTGEEVRSLGRPGDPRQVAGAPLKAAHPRKRLVLLPLRKCFVFRRLALGNGDQHDTKTGSCHQCRQRRASGEMR